MSHATQKASVVAFCDHPEGAKQSVRKLKKHGIDIKKLSIAGREYHPSSSLFITSGLGAIAVSGPLVVAIVSAFKQGANIRGLDALREGLYNIGIPKENIFQYESTLKKGFCLVCARGPIDKIAEVKRVFALSKAIEITGHYR